MPSPWSFTLEPLFIGLGAVAVWLYVRAWRAAESPLPSRRAWCFGAGIALVVLALNSPLETIAVEYLVLFHLLQNVIISDWAPPLLIIGLGPVLRAKLASRLGRGFASLTRPQVALPVWLVGWYVVHLADVYDVALRHPVLLNLEHLFLIAIGFVFWWPVISDTPRNTATLIRIAYVFAAFVLSAFLGLALTFAPSFYAYYEDLPKRLWGLSADADQNLGGVLMTSEQAIVLFAAIAWLLVKLFHEEEEAERQLAAGQRRAGLRDH
jgi:putative membrane protein